MKKIVILIICIYFGLFVNAQQADTTKSNWDNSVYADLVSRYVWRGSDFGNSPAIQPGLDISYKNFTVGAWGSASLASLNLQEADLFASY